MGWKDILRPIRDGFRDNLPCKTPPADPAAEQRRRQDALKGFTYFDSFDQVYGWHPDRVHSFQRSNTPLLPRSGHLNPQEKAHITLIHDFAGNYHDYENVHTSISDRSSYSCEYLQHIYSFVYFSHKLVCIPPPSWTNTLHRNGVKSLGTFLVEPQSVDISKILERSFSSEKGIWEYTFATQLVTLAHFYGFDGFLVNIEKTFSFATWKSQYLEGFLRQLSSSFGDGCVIWYDSLTHENRISYQNGLTEQNLLFAKAAGCILTNYVWNPQLASKSRALALKSGFDPANILGGIDVWAQNSTDQTKLRETYPKDVGGGTGTGLGVAKLAEMGLSAGIFAPAWAYEHFPSHLTAIERSMWLGEPLPDSIHCNCTSESQHKIPGYREHPIRRYAQESPVGSEGFFFTDFTRAFETTKNDSESPAKREKVLSHLSAQSVLPRMACGRGDVFGRMKPDCSGYLIYARTPYDSVAMHKDLELFTLNMSSSQDLIVRITYRKPEIPDSLRMWFQLGGTDVWIPIPTQGCGQTVITEEIRERETGTVKINGIRLQVERQMTETSGVDVILLAEILAICIQPKRSTRRNYAIIDVTLQELEENTVALGWRYRTATPSEPGNDDGLPFSALTGPFSYFVIKVDGRKVGRAYALEYVLADAKETMEIQITGIGFDGEQLCEYTGVCSLKKDRTRSVDSWQLI